MRTNLQTNHLAARMTAFKLTTAGSTSTGDIGKDDATTLTRSAAGKTTVALREAFARAPIVIATPGENVALGGFATYDTDPAIASVVAEFLGVAGSGDDGTGYAMAFGNNSVTTDFIRSDIQEVFNTNGYEPILLPFLVTSAGVATIGRPLLSAAPTPASSIYTFGLKDAFCRTPLAFATPIHTSAAKALRINSVASQSIAIAAAQSGGTPEDNAFCAVVLGWMNKEESYQRRCLIRTPRRKVRIFGFKCDGSSGTPVISYGSGDVTVTDNGVGDYSIAYASTIKPKSTSIVLLTGKATRTQLKSVPDKDGCRILAFNAGGSAADDDVCGLVLAFDDADEYTLFG